MMEMGGRKVSQAHQVRENAERHHYGEVPGSRLPAALYLALAWLQHSSSCLGWSCRIAGLCGGKTELECREK